MTPQRRSARITASVVAIMALAGTGIGTSAAAPRVVSQPGTQKPQQVEPATAPVAEQAPVQQYQPPAPQQIATPVQRVEVVRYVPGAPQAVQPVIVKNVITKKVVYETSPGLAMVSPGGSRVLNPVNVANTFNRNIRKEDRSTLEAAGGAAAGGAVAGTVVGAGLGLAGGGLAGAGAGVGAGAVICTSTVAATVVAPPLAPFAAACWAAGPTVVGPAVGAVSGGTAGAIVGAPAGALVGAQAGAATVPGGRAALDRTIADTTWDLESQARVAQGAEPLAGEKPGESMPSGPQAAAHSQPAVPNLADVAPVNSSPVVPTPAPVVLPPAPLVPQVNIPAPPLPAVPQVTIPEVSVPALPQVNVPGLNSSNPFNVA